LTRLSARVAALLLAGWTAAALALGCDQPTCDELHDPACWVPPVDEAGSDAEEDANDDAAADRDAPAGDATIAAD